MSSASDTFTYKSAMTIINSEHLRPQGNFIYQRQPNNVYSGNRQY